MTTPVSRTNSTQRAKAFIPSWLSAMFIKLIVYGIPIVFILLPLAIFLTYSFWRMENGRPVADFTFDNYTKFFEGAGYLRVFLATLRLTGLVAAISLIAGYIVAYSVWRLEGRMRNIVLLLSVLPLSISYIVKIYAMRSILGFGGFFNQFAMWTGLLSEPSKAFLFNQTAVTLSMAIIYLPFGILPIFLSLERIPKSLVAASADLGATPWQTFKNVVLPLSLPGAIAGSLFVMVLALGDFLTPQMVGGTSGFTFGRAIWSQFGLSYNWPFGAAMAVILLIAVAVVMVIAGAVSRTARLT